MVVDIEYAASGGGGGCGSAKYDSVLSWLVLTFAHAIGAVGVGGAIASDLTGHG